MNYRCLHEAPQCFKIVWDKPRRTFGRFANGDDTELPLIFGQLFGNSSGAEFFGLQVAENQQEGSSFTQRWRLCDCFKSSGDFRRPVWNHIRQSITKSRKVDWLVAAIVNGFCVSVKYDNSQLVVYG